MADLDDLVPVLKPAEWEPEDTFARRALGRHDAPWIAYGWDFPTHFRFLRTDELPGLGLAPHTVHARAVQNLSARSLALTEVPVGHSDSGVWVLGVEGVTYADAAVLDPLLMRRAATRLGTELLAAVTPARGLILLGDGRNRLHVAALESVAAEVFTRADRPPITDGIWLLVDGEVVGVGQGVDASAEALRDRYLPPALDLLRLMDDRGRIRALVAHLVPREPSRIARDAKALASELLSVAETVDTFDGLCVVWVDLPEDPSDHPVVRAAVDEAREWAARLVLETRATTRDGRPLRVDVVAILATAQFATDR